MVGQVRAILSSPRRRRRLIALGVVLVVAAVVSLLIAFDRNSAKPIATPVSKGKPFTPAPQPKSVKFTKAEANVVLPIARRFLTQAVDRKNMHAAWQITAPVLRGDTSRKEWDRGENTEVVPFPLDHARWRVGYSYRNAVGLEIAVFPRKHSYVQNPMVFYMELTRAHRRAGPKWLVDQWLSAPGSAQVVQGANNPLALDRSTSPPQGLGSVWLLVPVGVLALILLIPLTLGVREWRRGRRARRNYEAGLPPLPGSRSSYTSSSKPS